MPRLLGAARRMAFPLPSLPVPPPRIHSHPPPPRENPPLPVPHLPPSRSLLPQVQDSEGSSTSPPPSLY